MDQDQKPLLPDDYDTRCALCTPADQRVPQPLRGGERLGLLNLSAEGTLVLELPRIDLELRSRSGRKTVAHEPPMLAEPDERRLSLVWQSALRVAAPDADYLDETEITEKAGAA